MEISSERTFRIPPKLLIYHVTSRGHMSKGQHDLMGESPSHLVIILQRYLIMGFMECRVERFIFVT